MYSRKFDPRITNFKVVSEYELYEYTPAQGWIILETFKIRNDQNILVYNVVNGCQNSEYMALAKEDIKFLVGQTIAKDLLYGE